MNTKKKICLISRVFNPRTQGIGRYGADLLEGLKEHEDQWQINIVDCKYKSAYGYIFFVLFELMFRHKKADIYHVLSPLECLFSPAAKTVVTVHDLIPILYLYRFKNTQDKLWLSDIFMHILFVVACRKVAKCKKIVCISEKTKKDFLDLTGCNENKIEVIDNCAQNKYVKKERELRENTFAIGTLSIIDKRKRIRQLVDNFMKIKDDRLRLLIGGNGPEKEVLQEIAAQDKRITFLGFVPEEKMDDFYHQIDLFVFPSICEGFGIPVIEAARSYRPVFTLEDAIIPENVVACSKSVTWNNFEKETLKLVDEDNEWKRLADYCYVNAEKFNKQRFITNYLELYNNITVSS